MSKGRFNNPVSAAWAGFYDLFRRQELETRFTEKDRLQGKTVLITGANSGLGFALSVSAAEREGEVIMACRRQIPEAGLKAAGLSGSKNISMRHLDLCSLESIHSFVDGLAADGITIDVLILNAASAAARSRPVPCGQDELFMVNYFSNYVLVNLLLKKGVLKPDTNIQPRIIFISSDSHRGASAIDYDEFGHFTDYGVKKAISNYSYFKLVLNTFAVELGRRTNRDGIRAQVNCICPGPVNTNIIRETPLPIRIILRFLFSIIFRSPPKAARPVIYLASSPDFHNKSGKYLHMFIPKRMDEKCYDEQAGRKLWDRSAALWQQLDEKADLAL